MEKETWVVKVDGKAKGKGVLVSSDWSEVMQTIYKWVSPATFVVEVRKLSDFSARSEGGVATRTQGNPPDGAENDSHFRKEP